MKSMLSIGLAVGFSGLAALSQSTAPEKPKTEHAKGEAAPAVLTEKTAAKTKAEKKSDVKRALVSTLAPEELTDYSTYPEEVKLLILQALELTQKRLTYLFGSSDPGTGGMDCSGTIFHLLQKNGVKGSPRQSDEMCDWVAEKSIFYRTEGVTTLNDPKFAEMKPGDLLFWTGTYSVKERLSRVSHVMLYLGKRKRDGAPVIFGASDGRSYDGQQMCGVSVFDFKLPSKGGKAAFYGFGSIPREKSEGIRTPGKK